MDKHNLNQNKEQQEWEEKKQQYDRELYLLYVSLFIILGLTMPSMALACLFTFIFDAITGEALVSMGVSFILFFILVFGTMVFATVSVLTEDPKDDEEEDIIHALFGQNREEDRLDYQEISSRPSFYQARNGNLPFWLYKVQCHFPEGSEPFNELEECKIYARELRKMDSPMTSSTFQLMLDVLKSYDSLESITVKTPKIKQELEDLKTTFPMIRKSLCSAYERAVMPQISKAQVNKDAFVNSQKLTEDSFFLNQVSEQQKDQIQK